MKKFPVCLLLLLFSTFFTVMVLTHDLLCHFTYWLVIWHLCSGICLLLAYSNSVYFSVQSKPLLCGNKPKPRNEAGFKWVDKQQGFLNLHLSIVSSQWCNLHTKASSSHFVSSVTNLPHGWHQVMVIDQPTTDAIGEKTPRPLKTVEIYSF